MVGMNPSKLSQVTDHEEFEIGGVNPLEYAILALRLEEFFQVVDHRIGWHSNTERNIAFNKTPNHTISHSGWGIIGWLR
jgi:hypothetical protein